MVAKSRGLESPRDLDIMTNFIFFPTRLLQESCYIVTLFSKSCPVYLSIIFYNSSLVTPGLLFFSASQTAGVPTSILYTHFSSSKIFQISFFSAQANTTVVLLLGPFQQC